MAWAIEGTACELGCTSASCLATTHPIHVCAALSASRAVEEEGEEAEERGDQSPMGAKLRAWQRELKARLGQAMQQLEPDLAESLEA